MSSTECPHQESAKRFFVKRRGPIVTGCLLVPKWPLWVGSDCTAKARPVVHVRSSTDRIRGMSSARYREYNGRMKHYLLNDR